MEGQGREAGPEGREGEDAVDADAPSVGNVLSVLVGLAVAQFLCAHIMNLPFVFLLVEFETHRETWLERLER